MKIDLKSIPEGFLVKEKAIKGNPYYLVCPESMSTEWTKDNLFLRSTIFDKDGNVVSMGFPKFFNWDERTDISPKPSDIEDCDCAEKLDGSLIIVSEIDGELIIRTRGSFDCGHFEDGGKEVYALVHDAMDKYIEMADEFPPFTSLLFEYVTPANRIVLHYEQPELIFLNGVRHFNGSLYDKNLIHAASFLLDLRTPRRYTFSDIQSMLNDVTGWKGKEGLCVYYNKGQSIKKVKAEEYLHKHRMKDQLKSFNAVLDLYLDLDAPHKDVWEEYLEREFDYETMVSCKELFRAVESAYAEYIDLKKGLQNSCLGLYSKSRKEVASIVSNTPHLKKYQGCFWILYDGKYLPLKEVKKITKELYKESIS